MKKPILNIKLKPALKVLSFFAFLLSSNHIYAQNNIKITNIDHAVLERMLSENSLLVDVRTPKEFNEGHIPGAVNIPLKTVSSALTNFGEKKDRIIVYCRSGYRAGKALNILKANGFYNLYHLEGDMLGWLSAENKVISNTN